MLLVRTYASFQISADYHQYHGSGFHRLVPKEKTLMASFSAHPLIVGHLMFNSVREVLDDRTHLAF